MTRLFQATPLQINSTIQLDPTATHHVACVLRAKKGDSLIIFNGKGGEYTGIIQSIYKKTVTVTLKQFILPHTESPLELCLAQGISRGEKMDYTIQKAVELGVKSIIPLLTERCNVKLDKERREKRLQHWQSIIMSACEQSGRHLVPTILPPQLFDSFLHDAKSSDHWKFVLNPISHQKLSQFSVTNTSRIILCVGPEGGFSDSEMNKAEQHGFLSLNLGPRILRTETAGLVALAALQCYFGDLT